MVLKIMCLQMNEIYQIIGVKIKKNSDGTFKLSQLHLVEKIINRVRILVSASIKSRETPAGKLLLYKYQSSLGRK